MDIILCVSVILIGVFAIVMSLAVIGVVLYSGEYDHLEEEWLQRQREEKERQEKCEKERPPDPDVLNPAWPEDRRHCGLLEEDEYD